MVCNEKSVLVLEDEPSVLGIIRATLQAGAFEDVTAASKIREARELWQKNAGRFDLFLTDFSLPDGSAPALIGEWLAEKPDLEVVLMSGFSEQSLDLDPALSSRIHLLPKPFRPSELLGLIRERLENAVAA